MSGHLLTSESVLEGLFPRQERQADAEFDITAMIDLVFMMNIYFLVAFLAVAFSEINLPTATHAEALDRDKAIVITVLPGLDSVIVYLGDGKVGTPITEPDDQERQIANAVSLAAAQGKTAVLLKAEKVIRLREMKRIASAAAHEGMTLHVAIMEKDTAS